MGWKARGRICHADPSLPPTNRYNGYNTLPTRDNITAPPVFSEASTLRMEATNRVTITVTGGGVMAQFALENPPGLPASSYDFQPTERRMLNAIYNWTDRDFNGARIVGVRVRRAVSTESPQVTIDAM